MSERGRIESFPLGQHDVASRFQIPSRLYGREKEIAAIAESFERVSAGATELLVVAGGSGTGKSVLVGEIQRAVTERRGHLVSGKFDQFSSHAPYASLIDALSELVRQLLGEPPEQLARWRDMIVETLGGNVGVVADVIPDISTSPALPRRSPNWAPQRPSTASTSSSANSSRHSPAPTIRWCCSSTISTGVTPPRSGCCEPWSPTPTLTTC